RNATIRAQFSLAGGDTKFNLDWGTILADLKAFQSGNSNSYFMVELPQGMTQEQFEETVEAAATDYSAPKYAPAVGPNSNSAVGWAVIMSGAKFPQISGWSRGAWQWDWWFPEKTPYLQGP